MYTLGMALTMTVTEARTSLPAVLDRVERGEEVTITRHGRPVAVVVAPELLRVRRADDAFAAAERLRVRMEDARLRPLSPPVLTAEFAEELIAEIHAGRADR